MTDAPEVPTPEGQTEETGDAAATATPTQKGRPRPETTVQRDEQAKQYFAEAGAAGLTRETLAEKLDTSPSEAYLSIYRLSRANPPVIGKTRDSGKVVWKLTEHVSEATTEVTPAPEAQLEPAPQL